MIKTCFLTKRIEDRLPASPCSTQIKKLLYFIYCSMLYTHTHTTPSGVSTERVNMHPGTWYPIWQSWDFPYKLDITLEKALWSYNFSRGIVRPFQFIYLCAHQAVEHNSVKLMKLNKLHMQEGIVQVGGQNTENYSHWSLSA